MQHVDRLRLLLVLLFLSPLIHRGKGMGANSADDAAVCECNCSTARTRHQCVAQSDNFVVRSFVGGPAAVDVANTGESLRDRIWQNVLGGDDQRPWQPKCQVVLHGTRQAYREAVEGGGGQTVGSSTVMLSGGRVTRRRIDLMAADAQQGLNAMPHELVHILFADTFPNSAPPKWAEEGLALLLDPSEKRKRHIRDLHDGLRTRSTLPLSRVLGETSYPATSHRSAFYAQSLSLVEYLTQLDSPKEFMRFVQLSTESSHEIALSTVYGLNTRELDRRWREHVATVQFADSDQAPHRGSR